MAVAGGPNIIEDGLVLALDAANKKSYPGSGTTWYDLSENNYNTALQNGPSAASTGSAPTLFFDGTDDYALVTGTGDFSITPGFTVCSWYFITSFDDYPNLIIKGPSSVYGLAEHTFGIRYEGSGTFRYSIVHTTATRVDITTNRSVDLNRWVHLTANYDGTTMKAYFNGEESISTTVGGTPISYAGNIAIAAAGNGSDQWNGHISSVYLYNRALTASEVLQNYNATKGRFGL